MSRQSAETGVQGKPTLTRRSDRFLAGLENYRNVVFVSHVHPDPDSLGSMMGLAHLVETKLNLPTRITQDGEICRAENKAMVDVLEIELVPIDELAWDDETAIIMVDSQPKTGRHSFKDDVPIYAVIDHHQTPGDLADVAFLDIRQSIGATCSLVTKYLIEQEVAITLYYGIETELSGYPREASPLDDTAIHFLFPMIDKDLIAQIRNAPLPEMFYETLLQGLQSSFIYDNLLISWINDLPAAELCAQCVDFLIRHEGIEWALCAGVHEGRMILSMRSTASQAQAGEVLRQVAHRMGGRAGGHDRRAGGFIPLPSTASSAIDQVQSDLRKRLLKALQIEETTRGRRLVSRNEMLRNMQ
jgi:nanoRNase/pAp phosphatase (c-di-AMP/oligoRNAs hydrolase)